jgi:hypothetical protein
MSEPAKAESGSESESQDVHAMVRSLMERVALLEKENEKLKSEREKTKLMDFTRAAADLFDTVNYFQDKLRDRVKENIAEVGRKSCNFSIVMFNLQKQESITGRKVQGGSAALDYCGCQVKED